MAKSNKQNQYAYLDQLSTQELKELLRADIDSPIDGDVEAIFYILEVMEKREKEHPSGSFPDVDKSWNDFKTIYHTPEGTNASLYPSDDENHVRAISAIIKRPRRIARKTFIAAVIVVLLVAFMTVPVAGHSSLFEMIGRWTTNQFTFMADENTHGETGAFSDKISDAGVFTGDVGSELRQVLYEHEIYDHLAPSWMPDGYELLEEISVQEFPDFGVTEFFASYSNGDELCAISITKHTDSDQGSIYEKTSELPELYIIGDVEHYLVENSNTRIAAWYVDNVECSIHTTMSSSELKRVINSIYKE